MSPRNPPHAPRVGPAMRSLALAATLLIAAAASVVLASHLAVGLASERVITDPSALDPRAVVIVPGAGLRPDGTPHGLLTERLVCARDLFARGRVRHVLVSGDGGSRSHDEPNAMRRWLVENGVPESKIQMDFAGFRTRDTMQRAARVFAVKDAVICTQALHANRSVFLALDAGIDASALVARGDAWLDSGAWLRERAAIVMAFYDMLVQTEPRFLGPQIPIGLATTLRRAP